MVWSFDDDGNDVPHLTIEDNADALDAVLSHFGVDSVDDLEQQELGDYETRNLNERRFGVVKVVDDEMKFVSETELLSRVEGISRELAAGLVDECGDIPSICERQRMDPGLFLGELLNDAKVEGREWVDDLERFCDETDNSAIERRMKDAGIWVEPENTVAGV